MKSKDIVYPLACLCFTVIIGGAVYEHLAVVPQWSAAPPASLSMFQGEYGINQAAFWKLIHPVTLLVILATLILFWKSKRRKNILITLIGYVVILAITTIYFVPELIEITGTAFSATIDPSLTNRANLWEILSFIRLFFLIILAMVLFLGLTKVNTMSTIQQNFSAEPSPTAKVVYEQ